MVNTMTDCIWKGNWKSLIEKYEPLFDRYFLSEYDLKTYLFYGIVWASDDFYFAMMNKDTKETKLLTCVGRLADMGYQILN